MALPLGIQIAATGLSMYSQIQQGKAAKSQAAFNRQQYEQSARQSEIEALQKANIRMRDFESAQSANMAFFSFMNRDTSDRSMKAFMDRQKEIALSDVESIESTGMMTASQQRAMAGMEAAKGRSAGREALLGATTSIVTGMYRYHQYKTD